MFRPTGGFNVSALRNSSEDFLTANFGDAGAVVSINDSLSAATVVVSEQSLVLRDSSFTGLWRDFEAPLWIRDSDVGIVNSSFTANRATVAGGLVASNSSVAIENCTFADNTSETALPKPSMDSINCSKSKARVHSLPKQ